MILFDEKVSQHAQNFQQLSVSTEDENDVPDEREYDTEDYSETPPEERLGVCASAREDLFSRLAN